MRAFIAIELPESVQHALQQLQRRLAELGADVTWVERPQRHVTMRFLGEITEAQRDQVEALMAQLGRQQPPVRLHLLGLGAFPTLSSPRIVWAGVREGAMDLARLAGELNAGLAGLQIRPDEHPFAAHVTLGRVRSARRLRELSAALGSYEAGEGIWWEADHWTLFRSVLTSQGPLYEALARVAFSGATPASSA